MIPLISLSRALFDTRLLGGPFQSQSFWTWKTVAKLIDGEPLREQREIELFHHCTGRSQLPTNPVRRLIALVGRRGGKDRFMSAVAVWRAALCADWEKHISAGEQAVVLLLGADRKQAGILRRYCEGLLRSPLLAQEVTRRTDEVIEFRNGASLEIATNDARLVRGRSAIAVLGSECAHWRTDEHAASSDEEVVDAAEPSMAMCPDGGVLLLGSSVHRKKGYMYRKFKQLHGNEDTDDICWFAPSAIMNPKLPQDIVERALAEDAAKAGAEYLNRWRDDLSDFIPLDVVESCSDFGVHERPPQQGIHYVAYCDPAGGTGSDSFTIAIAHREYDKAGTVRVDLLRERKPRFVPAVVISEYAPLLRLYGITEVQGDKFAGGFHADEWQRNGISFKACANSTAENYLHALPMLLSGRARLLDNSMLRGQLVGLERHVQAGGRETVTHAHVASAHDDLAASVCGALVAAGDRLAYDTSYAWVGGGNDPYGTDSWHALRLSAYLNSGGRTILW
ncbi:MAG: hypothetical protein WB677_15195 [Xanthobacteraceae bacterium]